MEKVNLRGALVALATPLQDNRQLDREALARLIEHVLRAGVVGIAPAGSTGEGPHLPPELRHELLKDVVHLVNGRVSVIPGVTACTLVEIKKAVSELADLGADAALVTPPFYYPLSTEGLERFFIDVASQSPVPILIYHIPQMTKNPISAKSVGRLAQEPLIVGIKDSGRDFEYHLAVIEAVRGREDFSVLMGTDTMVAPSLLMGGHGAVMASANLVPDLGVRICDAVSRDDDETARAAQRLLTRVVIASRRGTFPAGWKAALEWAGLCQAWMVPPMPQLAAADAAALGEDLAALNLMRAA